MFSTIKNILLGFAFVVLILSIPEIILRNTKPFPLSAFSTYSTFDDVVFFHTPNSKGYERSEVKEFKDVFLQYNPHGFRGNWQNISNNKEVNVMLGDSFIEARQVDEHKTATELLNQKYSDKFFINAGCSQYTTTTEYLLLKYRLLKYKPKNVFLFFAFNDYADNAAQYGGGFYTQENIFEQLPEKRFQPPWFKYFIVNFSQHISEKLAIVAYLKEWFGKGNSIAPKNPLKRKDIKFYSSLAAINKHTEDMDEKEKKVLNFTHQGLKEIQKLCNTYQINLKIFIMPLPTQISKNEWQTGKSYYIDDGEDYYEQDHTYQNRLISFCKSEKLDCIDMFPYFKEASKKGKLHFDFDAHWTEYGQEVVASIVSKNIQVK